MASRNTNSECWQALGADNDSVYGAELGLSAAEIADLRSRKVI